MTMEAFLYEVSHEPFFSLPDTEISTYALIAGLLEFLEATIEACLNDSIIFNIEAFRKETEELIKTQDCLVILLNALAIILPDIVL